MVSNNKTDGSNFKFRWRTDLDLQTIIGNCEKRGWGRGGGEDEWNLYWALPYNAKHKFFNPNSGQRLSEY